MFILSKIKTLSIYVIRNITALLPGAPFKQLRRFLWRSVGFNLHPTVNVMPRVTFMPGVKGTSISVGAQTFIGYEVLITGGDIQIGTSCDLAPHCIIHAGTHTIGSSARRAGESISGSITIGDGCWIGTGAIVLANVKIGPGTIVAAGSIVTAGQYPANVLLAGNPAVIKKRLNDKTA